MQRCTCRCSSSRQAPFTAKKLSKVSCQSATGSVVASPKQCAFDVSLQQFAQAAGRRSHVRKATEVKSEEKATEDPAEQGLPKGEEYEVTYCFCHHLARSCAGIACYNALACVAALHTCITSVQVRHRVPVAYVTEHSHDELESFESPVSE